MLNQQGSLDRLFHALADPGRRVMVDRLSRGPASVSELAKPLAMSLPAVVQHLQVLEASGLIRTEKVGRVRTCRIEPAALSLAEQWITERRVGWEQRLDRLGAFLGAEADEFEERKQAMKDRSIVHASFTIERTYDAPPKRVFNAFADKEAKAKWFGAPDDGVKKMQMDFRVGGREHSSGKIPNGPAYTFDALYQDIVPDERIVYTYDMTLDGQRISVSLATIELKAAGSGTHLKLTEMGAFLDGLDNVGQREAGTKDLLDKLGKSLKAG